MDRPLHNWILNKNVAVFALLLPFGALSLYQSKNKIAAFFLIVLCILVLSYTDSQSSLLCLIVMAGAGLLIYMSSGFLKLFWVGMSVALISMPFIAPYLYQHFAVPMGDNSVLGEVSFSSRLEIWDFISAKIMQQPWIGYGLDTTRYMIFDNPGVYHKGNTVMHPHSAVLQVWNDFGLLGVLTMIGFWALLLRHILQKDKLSYTTYGAVFAGLSVFLMLSWSLWASWLLGLIFFLPIMTYAVLQKHE